MIYKIVLLISFLTNIFAGPVSTRTCSWTCDTMNCIKCLSKTPVDGGYNVDITFAECKDSAISWVCCKNNDCSMKECDGILEGNNKCEQLTHVTYFIPNGNTNINLQIHDGKLAGNVICSNGACCGGSGTSCTNGVSGVCDHIIHLDTCPTICK